MTSYCIFNIRSDKAEFIRNYPVFVKYQYGRYAAIIVKQFRTKLFGIVQKVHIANGLDKHVHSFQKRFKKYKI